MADEPPEPVEEWVVRRIRELLVEGRLDELLNLLNEISPQPQRIEGQLNATIQAPRFSAVGTVGEMVAAVDSASPEIARDIRNHSPQDANRGFAYFMAFVAALSALMQAYQIFHGEPPSQQQIIQIFEQTVNQTINVVVNMPPPGHG